MIISSIKTGMAQIRANKRMLLIFYLANLFFGLILMLPFRAALDSFAGHSLMGQKLAGRLDMDFVFEFLHHTRDFTSVFSSLALVVAVAYWLFSLFLSGGALGVLAGDERFSGALFWQNAGRYFGRFFRLMLYSLPVAGILFCLQFIETGVQRLVFGADPYENVLYWGAWIRFGLRTLSILLFMLVLDYARIHAVVSGEHRMRVSIWNGLKFAFGNLSRTFSLAFLLFLFGVVVLVIYNPIADRLAAPSAMVVLLLFLLQQLYMLFRMFLRLTFYASELNLYDKLSSGRQTEPAPAVDDLGLQGAVS